MKLKRRYLVSLEIGENWDLADANSGGGVGKKFARMGSNISKGIVMNQYSSSKIDQNLSLKIATDFHKWAVKINSKSYQRGGVVSKPMEALNSTSEVEKGLEDLEEKLKEPLILGGEK